MAIQGPLGTTHIGQQQIGAATFINLNQFIVVPYLAKISVAKIT